jgi:beta-carotene hydroxylase
MTKESTDKKEQGHRPPPPISELGSDLLRVSRFRRVLSLALPFLCVGTYFTFALSGHWVLAVLSLMYLSFITYGSISHDLVHRNLGLGSMANDLLLSITELLAVRSGHAYQLVHLHHHARFPHDDDIEGAASKMTFFRTVLEGVILQPRIYAWAVRRPSRKRSWIVAEGIACLAIVVGAVISFPVLASALIYVVLMVMGSWVIPLITSYIPHAPEGEDVLHQTRRFRGKVASVIALEHLYHLEHHLYPSVPHHNWPVLARRLDPYLDETGIRATRLWF